jgi:23S rRNA (uracil1939-C5)-methyltransferase
MSRSKTKPLLEAVLITDVAAEGKALGHLNGIVVFVTQCVPGDIVDVQVIRKRKRFMEGYPVKFHKYSGNRSIPFCIHFGVCGGCRWQHLPYTEQIAYKQRQVKDMLERIGRVNPGTVLQALGSEKQTGYRNKLEYTFTNNRWLTTEEIQSGDPGIERRGLGFHIPGKFDKVLDIKECYLQPEPSNRIREFVKQFALEHSFEFFDLINQQGLLRNLIIRNNLKGEVMVIVSFFKREMELINKLLNALSQSFPEIVSLMYVINGKANDTLNDLTVELFKGNDHLVEDMEGLKFRISPKSFFQTNTEQAHRLYSVVRDFASLNGSETVYDLYTGTGTIALFLSKYCRHITGIEYVDEAIADAKINADLNQIGNASFFAGDIRAILTPSFIITQGHPDVIITDPPRNGMHADVVKAISEASPSRIVYVSCNPATQARDIEMLSDRYTVLKSQPVDMFPFTHHVENVALLGLNNG